jgi:hypothetical protein
MMARKEKAMRLQTQIIPPKQSPRVKAFDEKLFSMKERRQVLEAQVSQFQTVLSPYSGLPTQSDRVVVESRQKLPQVQADLERIGLDIGDLERERDEVIKAETAKTVEQINPRIREKVSEMRRLLEPVISVNREIYEWQLMQEQLLGIPLTDLDPLFLRELFREDSDETWWGGWCRTIAERFRV